MTRISHARWTRIPTAVFAGATLVWCAVSGGRLAAATQAQERSVWEGVYTNAQAERGAAVFTRACGQCHADRLGQTAGEGIAPAVLGSEFTFRWLFSTVGDLVDTISQTMPEEAPASLSPQEYTDISAYLLKLNEFPAGSTELPPELAELSQIVIDEKPDR